MHVLAGVRSPRTRFRRVRSPSWPGSRLTRKGAPAGPAVSERDPTEAATPELIFPESCAIIRAQHPSRLLGTMSLTNSNSAFGPEELQKEYRRRFADIESYRKQVWSRLVPAFFQPLIPLESAVLDLGCGYGEFINHVQARAKYALDLNPDASTRLNPDVSFLLHDCSIEWPLPPESLDAIFSSNFF